MEQISNWSNFGLHNDLVTVLDVLGFKQPSEVQERTLVYQKYQTNLIIASKTLNLQKGSGKTLCFLLPILSKMFFLQDKGKVVTGIEALVITPTRELANQIMKHMNMILEKLPERKLKICQIIGGLSKQKQDRILRKQPDIIIGTPGRLYEYIRDEVTLNFLIL